MASLFSLCLMALLLSTASAEPSRASPAAGSVDGWLHEAVPAAAPGGSDEGDAATAPADGIAAPPPPPPGRKRFRIPPHSFALSPEARRGLEHEARCGPRVPVRPGSPLPKWKPRCRGDDDGDAADGSSTGAAGAPAPAWLPLDVNEP